MALFEEGLKEKIKEKTKVIIEPSQGVNILWEAICEYVEENAEVVYQWEAIDSEDELDPEQTWTGTIITGGTLPQITGTIPEQVLADLSEAMNSQILTWTVRPAPGYSTTGGNITNPAINIKLSGATERDPALLSLSADIIAGIKAALPPVHSGTHEDFTGTTTSGIII